MPDPVAAPPQAPAAPKTPATIAGNIAASIGRRANGTSSTPPPADVADPKVAAPPTPPDPNAGKEKFVVEGREVWLTPEQSRAYIQKGLAFEPRMDQLARLQQETAQLQRALINDPGKVLANLAKSNNIPLENIVQNVLRGNSSEAIKKAVGEWYYEDVVEPMRLSPEELKARENEKWRKAREEQDKTVAAEAIKRENQARVDQAANTIKANIAEAMKDSGLPNNDTPLGAEMARMVADTMRIAHFQRQTITPKQAIEFVKKRVREVNSAYYETLDGQALVDALGPNVSERVKKHFLNIVKAAGNPVPELNGKRPTKNGERKTINLDDFHDRMTKLKEQG